MGIETHGHTDQAGFVGLLRRGAELLAAAAGVGYVLGATFYWAYFESIGAPWLLWELPTARLLMGSSMPVVLVVGPLVVLYGESIDLRQRANSVDWGRLRKNAGRFAWLASVAVALYLALELFKGRGWREAVLRSALMLFFMAMFTIAPDFVAYLRRSVKKFYLIGLAGGPVLLVLSAALTGLMAGLTDLDPDDSTLAVVELKDGTRGLGVLFVDDRVYVLRTEDGAIKPYTMAEVGAIHMKALWWSERAGKAEKVSGSESQLEAPDASLDGSPASGAPPTTPRP